MIFFCTDSTTLTSLLNTDVINRCRSIMNSKIGKHLYLNYPFELTIIVTVIKKLNNKQRMPVWFGC